MTPESVNDARQKDRSIIVGSKIFEKKRNLFPTRSDVLVRKVVDKDEVHITAQQKSDF